MGSAAVIRIRIVSADHVEGGQLRRRGVDFLGGNRVRLFNFMLPLLPASPKIGAIDILG